MVRNHPFITHTKFSEKKIFLAYWYTHPRVFQGVRNIFFFSKKISCLPNRWCHSNFCGNELCFYSNFTGITKRRDTSFATVQKSFIHSYLIANHCLIRHSPILARTFILDPWKRQKTRSFLTFSGVIEIEHWARMSLLYGLYMHFTHEIFITFLFD